MNRMRDGLREHLVKTVLYRAFPDTQQLARVIINFGWRPRVRLIIKITPYKYAYPYDKKEGPVSVLPLTCESLYLTKWSLYWNRALASSYDGPMGPFTQISYKINDDVIKWKHFSRYWAFLRGIHRSPVNSPQKGQWRGELWCFLRSAWMNGWVNNREAGDLRRHRAHYDVTVMMATNFLVTGLQRFAWVSYDLCTYSIHEVQFQWNVMNLMSYIWTPHEYGC